MKKHTFTAIIRKIEKWDKDVFCGDLGAKVPLEPSLRVTAECDDDSAVSFKISPRELPHYPIDAAIRVTVDMPLKWHASVVCGPAGKPMTADDFPITRARDSFTNDHWRPRDPMLDRHVDEHREYLRNNKQKKRRK